MGEDELWAIKRGKGELSHRFTHMNVNYFSSNTVEQRF